ncbi:MAG: hypothetical protein FJ128_11260 [Deltaproteobacteria bacterium]|nr:hypothetical protein [Deltaproteobacteria bacterium]
MRQAGAEFLQEENRRRGARPRVKAVVYPFALDYGLATGSGEFVNTAYGGETGRVDLEGGYVTSGSWTSPVMHTFSPNLDRVAAIWEDGAGYLEMSVYLRSAAGVAQVAAAPYEKLTPGQEAALAPYFQVKVEFVQTDRNWAVDDPGQADGFTAYALDDAGEAGYDSCSGDGSAPGYVAGLSLEGLLSLPEGEIIDAGRVRVELARDFGELRSGDHILVVDNRSGQWLPGSDNFYFLGLPWREKRLALHHGWELPGGAVEWLPVYQGVLERLGGMSHAWRGRHRAQVESQDWLAARLRRSIGGPGEDGERRPFLRGAYRARAELTETTAATVDAPVKSGSGSAILTVAGAYRGEENRAYRVTAETTGELGSATFRWSANDGQSWRETGIVTTGPEDPVRMEEGLAVYFEAGIGNDFVAGDTWTFTARAPVFHYRVYGAPFESITDVYLNGEETRDRVAADPADGVILVTGRSASVEARVVKDATTHPVDIISDILAQVGLEEAVHQDSFDLARSLTPEYAVGVCFENLPAAEALREVVSRTLFDLWVDCGEIKMRAYLGE